MDEGHPDYAPVLPRMHASVKTHKEAWPALVIAASRAVSTTGLSRCVGRGLRAMSQGCEKLWLEEMLKAAVALGEGQQCGSWIVWDGVQVVDKVHRLNKKINQ